MSGSILGTSALTPYQTISFAEIPSPWLVPGTYVEVRPNYVNQGLATFPAKALIIAPMVAAGGLAGTAVPGQVYPVTRKDQPAALFGAGSSACRMALRFLAANPTSPLYVMGVTDPTGAAAAAGAIVCSGAPTANGTLALYVGGVYVPVTLLVGDTPAAQATKITLAIDLMTNLPVVATANAATVNLTAKNAGLTGNAIDVRCNANASDAFVPGAAQVVTPMAGGAGVPTLTTYLATIASQWFTDIMIPWTDAATLGVFAGELANRYKALGKLDAQGYVGASQTYAAALTFGVTQNSQYLSALPMQNSLSPPDEIAAVTGAVAMFNLTNDPARQLRGKALPGIVAPAPADRFTLIEQEQLLSEGLSTYDVLQDGTVVIQRLITTYQETSLGVADQSWLDVMKPKVLTRVRYDWRQYVDTVYAGAKLAPDGSIAAQYDPKVATPRRMANSWAARSLLYEQAGWIVNSAATSAASVFEIDANDSNRLDSQLQIQVIGNLIVQAVALEFTS